MSMSRLNLEPIVDKMAEDLKKACNPTNADMIRKMTDEQLAEQWPCPYDTAGSNIMPCILDDNVKGLPDEAYCRKCMLDWLQKEAKE